MPTNLPVEHRTATGNTGNIHYYLCPNGCTRYYFIGSPRYPKKPLPCPFCANEKTDEVTYEEWLL